MRYAEFSHPEDLGEDDSKREGTTGINYESWTVRKKEFLA